MKKLIYILIILVFASLGNAQWGSDQKLTSYYSTLFGSNNNTRCVASIGNYVHVVFTVQPQWDHSWTGTIRSTNGGISWGTVIPLATSPADYVSTPTVAVFGNNVYAVSGESDGLLYYNHSTNVGIIWSSQISLASGGLYPTMSVSDSIIHLFSMSKRTGHTGHYEIYYKRSTNGGTSWEADIRLTTNDTANSKFPSEALSGSYVHLVWESSRNGNPDIYYKRSTNRGITWGTDTQLTNTPDWSLNPSVSVSGMFVHVVWVDYRIAFSPQIYYKRSTDGGTTWGADTRLTYNSDTVISSNPNLTSSGLNVHVLWDDNRFGNYEIFYLHSIDGGLNWGNETRLTNDNAYSRKPYVSISGSAVHVIWEAGQIYYKNNPTGNVGIQNISTEIPSSFSLEQNYPNPFNPETKIQFKVSSSKFIKLTVFDILGKEVGTLVNETLKPGTYEVSFDGSKIASGVYFYRMTTDNYTATKKLTLIK